MVQFDNISVIMENRKNVIIQGVKYSNFGSSVMGVGDINSDGFADMMIGYAKGVGFPCKVKPDAFAATSVADKHNK